jgi:hypothetical protein
MIPPDRSGPVPDGCQPGSSGGYPQYGQPQAPFTTPVAPFSGQPTGKQILSASWNLLRQDRSLLFLPIMSAVLGLLAASIIFFPIFGVGVAADQDRVGASIGGILAALVASVVSIYFQVALVLAAFERVDGGDPTVGSALRAAWARKGPIIGWAILATTVGLVIRAIEQRLGTVGRLLGFAAGLAWAVATFLAVPVVAAEGMGPIDSVKRSAELIRQTWGTSLRTTLRFGILVVLAYIGLIVAFIVGIAMIVSSSALGEAVGIVVVAASIVAFIGLATVCGAISTYARAMIYRYSVGRPVPGVSPSLFAGAFAHRGGRRFGG